VSERSLASLLLTEEGTAAAEELVFFDGEWTGRAELVAAARALTSELEALGVEPGRAVVSLVPSSPPSIAAMFGVWAAGCPLVPLSPRLTGAELTRAVGEVRPAAVVAPGGLLDRHAGALTGCTLVEQHGPAFQARGPAATGAGVEVGTEVALVLYTSGTTGMPKPVMLRHESILAGLDAVLGTIGVGAAARRAAARSKPPMPNLVPFSLNLWSGLYNVCFSLRVGAPIVLMGPFDPREFARLVARFGIRSSVLAPGMLSMLLDDPEVTDLTPLRFVRNATAPLSPRQARRFRERFGVVVLNGYGQSELGGEVVGWNAADAGEFADTKLGAVGRPHPGVEVRILGDGDEPLPPGEVGEVCVRSPYVMAGYLVGVAGTTARFTADGLLRTGDLGRFDADGFLWLEGRRSALINRSGLKVLPGEVEEVLRASPLVADVAVAGMPDERLGEVPWAFVVLRGPGESPPDLDARLEAVARERLAPYKVPARFVVVDELPRNEVGKVVHRELQARFSLRRNAEQRLAIDGDTPVERVREVVAEWVDTAVPAEWRDAAARGGLIELRRVRPRAAYEDWYPAFAASGLVASTWPVEYCGLGVSNVTARAIDEVLAPYHLGRLNPLGLSLAGPTLLAWGTDEQKARYLPPIVYNEERWCQLFSEPGAGSDLASLATGAVRDGDEWVISGQKVWSTWAHESHFALTLARSDPGVPKREGITYFIVPVNAPGVVVRPLRQMTGEADFNEVFLDGVRVPDALRIGPVGGGWRVAAATLTGERQRISGAGAGGVDRIGGRSIGRLVTGARERAARDPNTGWGDPRVRQRVMRLYATEQALAWTNARARDARRAGRPPGAESSIGKLLAAELNVAAQEEWLMLLGAAAIARAEDDDDAGSVVRGFLRSRANTIEGGTSEVQRTILGERVLGLPREPGPHQGAPWHDVPRS
jgi:acyl-CoA synthetase (AMP-forming)/AMP-acid ligase II/alkylation response protein AidB-like acyl-CoA dehydrogenase